MDEEKGKVNHLIFWPSILLVLGMGISLAIWPEKGEEIVYFLMDFVTNNFGWLFLLFGTFCFIFLISLAISKYGNIKLGDPDDKPEFSYISWIGMLFTSGIGIGIMLWSIIEPIYYLQSPPFGIEAFSPLAVEWAHMYGQFHWGFSAWAIYCIPTIPIAYAVYVRKEPALRISSSCRSILGDRVDGLIGIIIDIIIVLGLVGAVGTSLGLAVPLVSALFGKVFGVGDNFYLNMIVLALWVAMIVFSLFRGLSKGIKILSDFNIRLAIALVLFVLIVGPTVFILSMWINSLGLMSNNFLRMIFWLDPVTKSGFPEAWTIFYWAWWIAYAPMMGLFVARISKGRTIRELVIAECIFGTLGCMCFFAIFGAYSLYLEINNIIPISQILNESGQNLAILAVLESLPGGNLVLISYTILCFVFLATTLNSSAYTIASICTKELKGDEEPARWNRVFWAIAIGIVAVGLILVGGLEPVKLSTIIGALPLIPVLLILIFSGFKMLREDYNHGFKEKS